MVHIKLSELDDEVQKFLARSQQGETIVIEDDHGTVQCGITPYVQASPSEKQAALNMLTQLQDQSSQSMKALGIDESQIDRELQN